MSNRANIEPTEFKNVRTGEKTYGVRVYDDYDQMYDNTWDSIPDNDMDVLREVLKSDARDLQGILEFIMENEKGICIGGNWYDWDEIKDLFEEYVE
jgi:hypothetical protein